MFHLFQRCFSKQGSIKQNGYEPSPETNGTDEPSITSIQRDAVSADPTPISTDDEGWKVAEQVRRRSSEVSLGTIRPDLYQMHGSTLMQHSNNQGQTGRIILKLRYDFQKSDLLVTFLEAKDLPCQSVGGSGDTFGKVSMVPALDSKIRQTPTVKHSRHPKFNTQFKFPIAHDDVPDYQLQVDMYENSCIGRPISIGEATLELDTVDVSSEVQMVIDLKDRDQDAGEILFCLNYLKSAHRLTVTICQARNLKCMDITGSSDPYVRILLISKEKQRKKRTNVVRRSVNPKWNQAFTFDIPEAELAAAQLQLVVLDKDLVGSNEVIGAVTLASSGVDESAKQHWTRLVKTRSTDPTWHTLKAGKS